MSRGLGKLQRQILATLESGPKRAESIAWDLFSGDDPHRPVSPTRAQVEAVNRAVRTLAERKLIQTGYQALYHEERGAPRLVCWLTGSTPAAGLTVRWGITGEQVRQTVLEVLRSEEIDLPEAWRYAAMSCEWVRNYRDRRAPEDVPAEALKRAAEKRLSLRVGRYSGAWWDTAFSRALRVLAAERKLYLIGPDYDYRGIPRRTHAVRPAPVSISVAETVKCPTSQRLTDRDAA